MDLSKLIQDWTLTNSTMTGSCTCVPFRFTGREFLMVFLPPKVAYVMYFISLLQTENQAVSEIMKAFLDKCVLFLNKLYTNFTM